MLIRTKLIIIFTVLLSIMSSAGLIFYAEAEATLRAATFERLRSVATVQKQYLERMIAGNLRILSAMTSRYQLRKSLKDYLDGNDRAAQQETLRTILLAAAQGDGLIWSLAVAGTDGTVIAATRQERVGQPVTEGAPPGAPGGAAGTLQATRLDGVDDFALRLTGPLRLGDQTIGTLIMEVREPTILELFHRQSGLGTTGEVVLGQLRPDGSTLFITPLRFDPGAGMLRIVPPSNKRIAMTRAVRHEAGLSLDLFDYRDVPVLAVTEYLPEADWGMVVKIDQAEAFAPIARLKWLFVAIFASCLVLGIAAAFLLGRTVTGRLTRLTAAALKIGQGGLKDLPANDSQDEVGILSRALQHMLAEVRHSGELLSKVINVAPVHIFVQDQDGRYLLANPALAGLYGLAPERLVGNRQRDLHPSPAEWDGFRRSNAAVLEQNREVTLPDERFTDRFGVTHILHSRKVPFAMGGQPAVLGVSLDITARTHAEIAADTAAAENEAKGRFLATMSHEIRTPMNAVLGFMALVLESELPAPARRQLMTAHTAAKSLLLLINDILDLSKLQNGKLELEQVVFNLPMVLRNALDMLRMKAREQKLELGLSYPDGLPPCYVGDPTRVRQIITNLVGNAIKFSETGRVTIAVTQAAEPDLLRITVSDTGIGMTPEQVERIFDPFVQADNSTTRRYGGTGLGISICKQLAEAMGGGLRVESEIGRGSSFHATLRLEAATGVTAADDTDAASEVMAQPVRRFRILLADDIPENTELAEIRLVGQGHRVTVAHDGREALDLARNQVFDVILMDVHMPVMDGLDATRQIRHREDGARPPVPIIAMTASVMPSEQRRCFDAGMTDFIAKPIDFGALFRLIETVVPADLGEAADPATTASCREVQDLPRLAGIDTAEGMRRWNDAVHYRAALISFGARYTDIADRLGALHAAGDWQAACQLAHALKGVAGNLAVSEVARIAAAIDEALQARRGEGVQDQIGGLAAAMAVAATSIDLLQREHCNHAPSVAPGPEHPASLAAVKPALEELLATLETDDPGTVEPVLDRLSGSLSPTEAAHLRGLVEEFEFEEAKTLVAGFAIAAADSSRLVH